MEAQFVFLLALVALEPEKIDTAYTVRAFDSRAQYGPIIENHINKQINEDYKLILGNLSYATSVAVNRRVSVTWSF